MLYAYVGLHVSTLGDENAAGPGNGSGSLDDRGDIGTSGSGNWNVVSVLLNCLKEVVRSSS